MKVKIKAIEHVCCDKKGLLGVILDVPKDDIVKMKDHQLVLTTDPRLIKACQLCDSRGGR